MITIAIKESNKCIGKESCFISFPFNAQIVGIMRRQPIRWYHPDTFEWEIPLKNQSILLKDLSDFEHTIVPNQNQVISAQNPGQLELVSNSSIIALEGFKPKTNPYNHQIDGLNFGLENDRFLLADEMGLGKSWQSINIAIAKKQTMGYKHCLIICGINGLKYNWQKEVEKHSHEKGYILGTRRKSSGKYYVGSVKDRLDDLLEFPKINDYFIITNIETLRDKNIQAQLQHLCSSSNINMIIFDEAHKAKNPSSQQTKGLLKLSADSMIAMTGTPLMNNPLDLYVALHWLGFEKHNYYQFKNHYCIMGGYGNHQIVGYRYLSQLKEQFADITLRRLKKEVLDLPDKVYVEDYVEMEPKQQKIYDEVLEDIKLNIDKVKLSNNPLAMLIRLRQATGYPGILSSTIKESAKLDRLEELVEDIVGNGGKCIVFSNWTQITNPVMQRLKQYKPVQITGESSPEERNDAESAFMNNDKCKVIVGTIGAMGTGLTLTAANTVIFLDEPWNMALKEQAVDRCHRIGTKENITIITLLAVNTIDERICQLVQRKGAMSDILIDGKIDGSKSELVDFLLG